MPFLAQISFAWPKKSPRQCGSKRDRSSIRTIQNCHNDRHEPTLRSCLMTRLINSSTTAFPREESGRSSNAENIARVCECTHTSIRPTDYIVKVTQPAHLRGAVETYKCTNVTSSSRIEKRKHFVGNPMHFHCTIDVFGNLRASQVTTQRIIKEQRTRPAHS